jgi:hypothetical protein
MKHYKELLLGKLASTGWELLALDDDTDWWLEESWKIKSIQQNWGEEIYILFLVDPQYEGRIKSQAVWAVRAVKEVPVDRPLGNECILEMDLQKGKLDHNLEVFVQGINEYRNKIGL